MKISVVLPCRNEESSIAICIQKIKKAFDSIKEILIKYFKIRNIKFDTLREHTFINFFNKDSVLVDLGANIGEFSKLLLKKYLFSKAILIEANPELIKNLKDNFKGKKNVNIVNAVAIGGKAKKVKFYLSKNTISSSIHKEFRDKFGENENQTQVVVDSISLRKIFKEFNLKKINLLKIDIEGAEWDFLKKFSKEDYKKIDQISMEFHDFIDSSLKYKSDKIINKLKNLGYLFINKGSDFLEGTPYKDCLFYKSELLKVK